MRTIKILHVASFTGNIGDNASHLGLYNVLKTVLGDRLDIEQVEIRRFYKKYSLADKMNFDLEFTQKANAKDLLILGGGGFLDYWVPNSETGTTFDMSDEILDKLIVPTLFVSVGCMPHQPVPEGNIDKFHHFLQKVGSKKNMRIAVRNDGSILEIKRLFGSEFEGIITEILDNGFFYEPSLKFNCRLLEKPYIAINTTLDQLTMKNRMIGNINYSQLREELLSLLQRIIDETDYSLAFVPHIFKDLQAFRELLEGMNDFYIRSRVAIAPYLQGNYGCNYLMSVYNQADSVLSMRFHANVCPLSMGKRTVGLAALDRVVHMYNSIGKSSDCIPVNEKFADKVYKKMIDISPNNSDTLISERKVQSLNTYMKLLSEIGLLS
ncbi:polysaccharide pyruvyl transferase family protein [Bacteroides stercorirosoris]|jgi:polysaccharide pyruvyl transferase WcaK-like protein|uniref:polysaccharide pyruvyl transferase family protein n=1 Tax=Bacteroides stercorirosoris TaxID=871324 RepID=UPI003520707A